MQIISTKKEAPTSPCELYNSTSIMFDKGIKLLVNCSANGSYLYELCGRFSSVTVKPQAIFVIDYINWNAIKSSTFALSFTSLAYITLTSDTIPKSKVHATHNTCSLVLWTFSSQHHTTIGLFIICVLYFVWMRLMRSLNATSGTMGSVGYTTGCV